MSSEDEVKRGGYSTGNGLHAALVLRGRDAPRLVRILPGTSLVVGRQPPSDVEVPDPSLSRQHARLTWDGEELSVLDLNSTNGTLVHGRAVVEARLRPGELLTLGAVAVSLYARTATDTSAYPVSVTPVIRSDAMAEVYSQVDQLSDSPGPAFVFGEAGVGKATVAAALHAQGMRASGPYHALRCGSLESDALAATLFGGSQAPPGREAGLLAACHRGTLYLSEAHLLPKALQEQLSEAHRARTVVLGDERVPADVLLVLSSHRDLAELVGSGTLLPQLAQHIGNRQLRIPPLRERIPEIRPLSRVFLQEAAGQWGRPPLRMARETLDVLEQCAWPRNVAQLRSVVEHVALVCRGEVVRPDELPPALRVQSTVPRPELVAQGPTAMPMPGSHAGPRLMVDDGDGRDFRTRVRDYEIQLILDALRRTGGNQRATSRLLRIPLRTLAEKIKAYGLKDLL